MDPKRHFPMDLAIAVRHELHRRGVIPPSIETLADVFETMYFASLKTEELQHIALHVVYLDPDDPDPHPPEKILADRWSYVPLTQRIPMTVATLLKIAKASDPRTSSFAIFEDAQGRPYIWGLIDQGNAYHAFINYEAEAGPERPGIFQASITGVGHIAAHVGYDKIAELKTDALIREVQDIFGQGPVMEAFAPAIDSYLEAIQGRLPQGFRNEFSACESYLRRTWTSSICRILLRVGNYRSGGAILVTPDSDLSCLSIRYGMHYDRLKTASQRYGVNVVLSGHAEARLFDGHVNAGAGSIPMDVYRDDSVRQNDLECSRSELNGCIWFISVLTRVDGLVVMRPDLTVEGFGVEITGGREPIEVFVAGDETADIRRLRRVDYAAYGTRHRSMMRYCTLVPGSVGFVISQDGDVRAMAQVEGQLVTWERVKLQLPEYILRTRKIKMEQDRARA
jgi:sensor domain DACNV-containing protein